MSEYQYYEFLALDRPLDDRQHWGMHRIMLRLPRNLFDVDVAEDYCVGDQVTVWTTGKFLVLDMTSEDDSGDWKYDPPGRLSTIVGVCTELAADDRADPAYLANVDH